jgi:hypothetical protein
MTQYTLTLTLTTHGKNNSTPVWKRRAKAIKVAERNKVTGWNGSAIEDGITETFTGTTLTGATWQVEGDPANVCDMIAIWNRHSNVKVTNGPDCPVPNPDHWCPVNL